MGVSIQRPADAVRELVWQAPGAALPVGALLVVGDAEAAVLRGSGRVLTVLGPGTHRLEPANVPALGLVSRGADLDAEVLLVSTAEVGWIALDGAIGAVRDPVLEESARVTYQASCSARVTSPDRLVGMLSSGPADAELALKLAVTNAMRTAVVGHVTKARVTLLELDRPEHEQAIAALAMPSIHDTLGPQGLELVRFGSLHLQLVRHDAERLAHLNVDALASTERAAIAQPPSTFAPGTAVEVPWSDGAVYRGVVSRLDAGRVEVRWDGTDRADWIAAEHVRASKA